MSAHTDPAAPALDDHQVTFLACLLTTFSASSSAASTTIAAPC